MSSSISTPTTSSVTDPIEESHETVPNDTVKDEASSTDLVKTHVNLGVEETKKKKKRSKKTKKKKGTGFEEFFCEPPLTPAEYQEEREVIYPQHRSFVDRIEECIQRYRARRRLDSKRNQLFSQYLMLGGIDVTVRQFQSSTKISDEMLAESSKSAIREMISDDVIPRGQESSYYPRFYNPNDPDHWEVDFTGVASGFLSEHIYRQAGGDIVLVATAADVVSNFLRYVAHHEVCPEYADDIKNALRVCDMAVAETVAISAIYDLLPGHFSTALRVLKCKDDDHGDDNDYEHGETVTKQQAIVTIAAIGAILLPELASAACNNQEWSVVDTSTQIFEVSEINLLDNMMKAKLASINHFSTNYADIEACGTFTGRRINLLDGWDHPWAPPILEGEKTDKVEFILEESILKLLKPGMKLTLVVCTTSLGWKFIKDIWAVKPSFYTFLPQELMLTFKDPVPNERPGPNVHDGEEDEFNINSVPIGDQVDD